MTDLEPGIVFPRRAQITASELRALVLNHPDLAQVAMALDGTISGWSEMAVVLFGWTAREAIGRQMMDLTVPPELHAALAANHDKHVELEQGLQSRRFEVDHVDRRGRRFLAEVHCFPVIAGDETTLYAFLRDVSARRVQAVDQRLAAIVDSSADAIIATDSDRLITDWNRAAEQLFGWTRPAIVGMPVDALTPPVLREQSLAAWRVAQQSSGYVRVDTQRMRRDGSLVDVELTITRVRHPDAPLACSMTYRDISERRRAERDLGRRTRDLRRRSIAERCAPPVPTDVVWRPDEEQTVVHQILELAREHLAMDVAWLSELTGDRQILHAITGDAAAFGLREGQEVPRAETACARLVAGEITRVHGDARTDAALASLHRMHELDVGAYVGVPVRLPDGRPFGTLCAIDHRARPELSERDADLLELLSAVLAVALDRRERDLIDVRSQAEVTALSALVAALAARDQYTADHSEAVVDLAISVAAVIYPAADEIETVAHVATLHDLGKVGVPDSILSKPGPLSDLEWELMREHPAIGARILAALAPLAHLVPAVRAEHERWDGRGYPDGLAGEQIPLAARITFACDAYHAMISNRPYRRALGVDVAIERLCEGAGTQFDPAVVAALIDTLRG